MCRATRVRSARWSLAAPGVRYGHVAAGTHDGLLIVYGGYTGSTYLQDLWAIRVLDYAVANNGHGRSC